MKNVSHIFHSMSACRHSLQNLTKFEYLNNNIDALTALKTLKEEVMKFIKNCELDYFVSLRHFIYSDFYAEKIGKKFVGKQNSVCIESVGYYNEWNDYWEFYEWQDDESEAELTDDDDDSVYSHNYYPGDSISDYSDEYIN